MSWPDNLNFWWPIDKKILLTKEFFCVMGRMKKVQLRKHDVQFGNVQYFVVTKQSMLYIIFILSRRPRRYYKNYIAKTIQRTHIVFAKYYKENEKKIIIGYWWTHMKLISPIHRIYNYKNYRFLAIFVQSNYFTSH